MTNRSFPLVRLHRRRWALTGMELTNLLGSRSRTSVSRIESGARAPNGRLLMALQVVFGVPPRTLFPRQYAEVEELVMRRAAALHAQIANRHDRRSLQKRALLEDMMKRATDAASA